MAFLNGEKDADWTEVALVTLHPREEIKIVLKESLEDTEPSTTHGFVNSSCGSSLKESRYEQLRIYLPTTSSRHVAGQRLCGSVSRIME